MAVLFVTSRLFNHASSEVWSCSSSCPVEMIQMFSSCNQMFSCGMETMQFGILLDIFHDIVISLMLQMFRSFTSLPLQNSFLRYVRHLLCGGVDCADQPVDRYSHDLEWACDGFRFWISENHQSHIGGNFDPYKINPAETKWLMKFYKKEADAGVMAACLTVQLVFAKLSTLIYNYTIMNRRTSSTYICLVLCSRHIIDQCCWVDVTIHRCMWSKLWSKRVIIRS